MYPAYPNGYYNNFYYFNGAPAPRPPKMKRRKRFLNSRNSQHSQPRSAETTTDYSDDESNNTSYQRRFPPRYQNGWAPHSGFNHFNDKFHRFEVDQNVSETDSAIMNYFSITKCFPLFVHRAIKHLERFT